MCPGNEQLPRGLIQGYEAKLLKLASAFRRAIMQCEPKTLCVTQQNFPAGACGDAALLLAKYLENQECGRFQYVLGKRDGYAHAWLEQDGLIIDITADQFHDQDEPVIVTHDHSWHQSFAGEDRHVADFEIYDPHTVADLRATLRAIERHIPPATLI